MHHHEVFAFVLECYKHPNRSCWDGFTSTTLLLFLLGGHAHTQLISDALNSLVHGPEFEGHESLTGRIATLHTVYHFAEPQVFWFGQLVSHLPGTMTTLEDKVLHDGSEMVCVSV